ncbi:equilibrative nucleobase transporter 1-like isoform 4-T9 [Salvelinus alpinus]
MLGCEGEAVVRRWLTLVTGLLECLCFAGVVFGWASLVFVLKTEGYFSYLCVNTTGVNGTLFLDCSAQDEQFSLIFTIASFMNNFLLLPNGFLFDRFGTMVTRLLGISMYTSGALFVAFSSSALSVLLFPALSCISVGGILFLVTNMQIGNLFGSARSTIITLYNGAFDSSSALFLIIKLLFEAGISLRASFLFLAACGIIHLVRTFLLLPRTHIPYPLPEGYTYGINCGQTKTFSPEQTAAIASVQSDDVTEETPFNNESAEKVATFWECFLSKFFLWHLVWLSVMQLRHYLFIGTLNPMLQRLTQGEPSLVSTYTNAFAVTQLCGVLCAPWNGLIMDRHKGKPRAPVPHLHPAGPQPILPLWRQCSLHQHCFSSVSLWEAVWYDHGSVCSGGSAAVPLLYPGQRSAGRRPTIREHSPDVTQPAGLHPSCLCLSALLWPSSPEG